MLYRADHTVHTARIYVEPYSRSRLPYRTAREMKTLYPGGAFLIVGEIGCFGPPPADGDMLLAGDGTAIPIYPRSSLTRPFEWVAGYVPMEGNAYAAAVAGVFPVAFHMKRTCGRIHH